MCGRGSALAGGTVVGALLALALTAVPAAARVEDPPRLPAEITGRYVASAPVQLLDGTVTVAPGAELVLLAGVVVKALDGGTLRVEGTLRSAGTPAEPVVLTAVTDDTVAGDTNGDGDASTPGLHSWTGIRSAASADVDLTGTEVRHAATAVLGGGRIALDTVRLTGVGDGVRTPPDGGPFSVTDSVIDAAESGLVLMGGRGNTVTRTRFDAIYPVYLGAYAVLVGNRFERNWNQISVEAEASDSIVRDTVVEGGGGSIRVWTAWPAEPGRRTLRWSGDLPYVLEGPFEVPPGVTLELGAGTVVKPITGAGLTVRGTLRGTGTRAHPVVLTSFFDDTAGGDTDLLPEDPARYPWPGIRAEAGAVELDGTQIRHATTGVDVARAATARLTRASFAGTPLAVRAAGPVDARLSWWGAADGPAPYGTGARVEGDVKVAPWCLRADCGQVTAVPGAPRYATAAAGLAQGAGRAVVGWHPPAGTGGSAITGYLVRRFRGDTLEATTRFPAATRSAPLAGLAHAPYRFDVVALNAVGQGPPSARTAAVTPVALPGPPRHPAATAAGSEIRLTWHPPAGTGGTPITRYRVTRDGTDAVLLPAAARSRTVTGLAPGTHTVTVHAVTAAGTGPAATATAVTPSR